MSRADPSPTETDPDPDIRRFAVLEHRWEGVHWDFLVEDGASLRTWAVDEPIRPGVTLGARALADHRRLYLDYEGPVGGDRGEVARWDSGTARVDRWGEREVRLLVRGAQLLGTVRLWLDEEGADRSPPGSPRRWRFRWGKLS